MRKLLTKQRLIFASVNVLLVLLVLICAILFHNIAGTLDSIDAAKRWRGDSEMRFAQLACFMPEDEPKSEDEILAFHRTLDQKLIDASLEAEEGKSLYNYAYSGSAKLSVSGDHGTASVKAIGVGGDFFLFHPLRLRSGSYISKTDLMQDRVVLDEALAWQLFGGYDVSGLTVTINEKPYYVAGVVRRENDFATKDAYLDGPGLFLSYSAFQEITNTGITTYELVMPDTITGFAKGIVEENFPVGSGDIVENSSRYSLGNLWNVVINFGQRSMRNNGVIYPYWENAVRLTEDYLALLLVLMLLFGICPAVTVMVLVIIAIVRLSRILKQKIPAGIEAMQERHKEKKYAKVGE